MKKSLLDLIKLLLPLKRDHKLLLEIATNYLDEEDVKNLRYFLKMDKLFGYVHKYDTSLFESPNWAEFKTHLPDKEVQELISRANDAIRTSVDEKSFALFSQVAAKKIPTLIASNIAGLEDEKLAASILLFAKEPFHILLLGDPGTGKTDVLRSCAALSPVASFGLGSGSSGVGLAATYKGDELILGLLPQANDGLACIDELNLMKVQDRASLYNAMEKGFVSYDKGGKHVQIDAHVRVIATANPKEDQFVGQGAAILKKQVPFQQALLSRFNLVFLIRRPDKHQLGEIARSIVQNQKLTLKKGDVEFMKVYVSKMLALDVSFPKNFEPMVVNFIEDLHDDENKFLVEIGPRTIVGVVRIAKAYARMHGREEVTQKDLLATMELFKRTLYVRKE